MSKNKKQTVTTQVDPRTQQYVNQIRGTAQGAAGVALNHPGQFFLGPSPLSIGDQAARFMNPYQQNVIDATRGEFDHLRAQAGMQAQQQATAQGAFGGSRAAIMQGSRLGALDRAQASQIANLQQQGYQNAMQMGLGYSEYERSLAERQAQEPLFRQQQALNFQNMGLGPYGTSQVGQQPRNILGGIAGGAIAGSSLGLPGIIGGGLLGGLFGG